MWVWSTSKKWSKEEQVKLATYRKGWVNGPFAEHKSHKNWFKTTITIINEKQRFQIWGWRHTARPDTTYSLFKEPIIFYQTFMVKFFIINVLFIIVCNTTLTFVHWYYKFADLTIAQLNISPDFSSQLPARYCGGWQDAAAERLVLFSRLILDSQHVRT